MSARSDCFLKKYMKVMKNLAEAVDKDKEIEFEKRESAVNELHDLYNAKGRTCYQLALLAIQIIWWSGPNNADLQKYGNNVVALCQKMQDQDPNFNPDGPLAEMLDHLEHEVDEAIAYVREQSDRVRRRSRAAKWGDSWVHRNLLKPRVLARSRPTLIKVRQEPDPTDTDGDEYSNGSCESEYEVMNIDDCENDPEEGEEEEPGAEYEKSKPDDVRESIEFDTPSNDSRGCAGSKLASRAEKEQQPTLIGLIEPGDAHKMVLLSSEGDAVAEINDLESSVYIKAFVKYWNEDPEAWRSRIDMWEETHGHANRSKLNCMRGGSSGGLREVGGRPFRMSERGARNTPKGSLKSSQAL